MPEAGLVDVHRYLTIAVAGVAGRVTLDVTFRGGAPWDGVSSLPLACGPGDDFPVIGDAAAEKRALEERHCDPRLREPFIAALSDVVLRRIG